jgi:hypothetical protein
MTRSLEQWIDYLEGELPIEEYELWGSLLRRSKDDRRLITQLESLREAVKLSDPAYDDADYIFDQKVHQNLHERIMQGVMALPESAPKEKRSRVLSKLYSGLEKTLSLRKPEEKS